MPESKQGVQEQQSNSGSLTKLESPQSSTPVRNPLLVEAEKLQSEIRISMPSAKEMRDGEPGTINRHRTWEAANRRRIERYNAIRLQIPTLPAVEGLRLS